MDYLLQILALLLCVGAAFLYSGVETGMYSLSRVRVELEADEGRRSAVLVRRLLRDESALLVTILIGNNLAIELISHLSDAMLSGLGMSRGVQTLVLTLTLSPVLFLAGEVLPKEVYRLRPHTMVYPSAYFVLASRVAYWPLERLLRGFSFLLERLFGMGGGRAVVTRGRERLVSYLAEGRRQGALHERAETLARNALKLRSIPLSRAMVPWAEVQVLRGDLDQAGLWSTVAGSRFTRLPVVSPGGRLEGYVHQLEVLFAGPESPVLDHLRSLTALAPSLSVDLALLHLRGGGRRGAVVGTVEEPLGWVTPKDLVEEISGDLVGL